MKKGVFIVIDGQDGTGKATQTKLLVARMQQEGLDVETISFPQYGQKSAGALEEYMSGAYGAAHEVGPYKASVLYAVDRFDAAKRIDDWLAAGKNVIADRFVGSNMGHQGSKIADPEERRRYFSWNEEFEHGIMGIPKPDLNIVLHIPIEVSLRLMNERAATGNQKHDLKKDIHEADPDHLKKAAEAYLDLVDHIDYFHAIECIENGALLSPEAIHERIWNTITRKLNVS